MKSVLNSLPIHRIINSARNATAQKSVFEELNSSYTSELAFFLSLPIKVQISQWTSAGILYSNWEIIVCVCMCVGAYVLENESEGLKE